ncbi:metallophosphoesterase family protein [Secundilactobacillus kimchicus]|nr:metallophosphoesterase [Secundilactobacillus kimchicus]
MKFIHSADLHLDSPFEGLKQLPDEVWQRVYRSPFLALTKLVDIAIENQVDFVLLAGDLYDQDTQSVAAQLSLKDQLQRLLDHQIAVYLSYGNHDYHPAESASIGIPADVVQFGPAVTTQT